MGYSMCSKILQIITHNMKRFRGLRMGKKRTLRQLLLFSLAIIMVLATMGCSNLKKQVKNKNLKQLESKIQSLNLRRLSKKSLILIGKHLVDTR